MDTLMRVIEVCRGENMGFCTNTCIIYHSRMVIPQVFSDTQIEVRYLSPRSFLESREDCLQYWVTLVLPIGYSSVVILLNSLLVHMYSTSSIIDLGFGFATCALHSLTFSAFIARYATA